jgi:hypothetical protein
VSLALEKHYRVKDLAALWGVSVKTIRRIFTGEAGVVRIGNHGNGNRKCVVLSIPESVALLVHERLSHDRLQAATPSRNPRRVVSLSDFHARVTEQSRNVPDDDATRERPRRERIA